MRFAVGMIIVLTAAMSHAAVYKWTDEQGRVHYSDKPVHQAEPVKLPAAPAPAKQPDAQRQLRQWESEQRLRDQERRRESERQQQADERQRQAKQQAAEKRHIQCERLRLKLERYRDQRRHGCRVRQCASIDERIEDHEAEWKLQCR